MTWLARAVSHRLLGWTLIAPAFAAAQEPLAVRVVNGTGAPLWNAEVIDLDDGRRVLTNERGDVSIPWNRSRPLRLRVRQIGYRFADSTLVAGQVRDAAVFTLQRVVYTLPAQRVVLRNDCEFGSDTLGRALAADALEQLRVAAERYDHLQKGKRYQAQLVRTTKQFDSTGALVDIQEWVEETRLDRWGERYHEGNVLDHRGWGFSVAFLHLQNFADPRFWKTHCFAVTEFVRLGEHKVLRLHFWPTRKVRTPDWEGWALIDSATSELRRVEFRLVGMRDGERPWRWEGFTTFTMPMPSIVVPESVAAVWWRDKPKNPDAPPPILQLIRLTGLELKK